MTWWRLKSSPLRKVAALLVVSLLASGATVLTQLQPASAAGPVTGWLDSVTVSTFRPQVARVKGWAVGLDIRGWSLPIWVTIDGGVARQAYSQSSPGKADRRWRPDVASYIASVYGNGPFGADYYYGYEFDVNFPPGLHTLCVYADNNGLVQLSGGCVQVFGYDSTPQYQTNTSDPNYYRYSAISYANKWWWPYDPATGHYVADCTNFTSEALEAGGMSFTSNSTLQDSNFPNRHNVAPELMQWLINTGQGSAFATNRYSNTTSGQAGDLLFANWGTGAGISHALMIADGSGPDSYSVNYYGQLVNQHTSDRLHSLWNLRFSESPQHNDPGTAGGEYQNSGFDQYNLTLVKVLAAT